MEVKKMTKIVLGKEEQITIVCESENSPDKKTNKALVTKNENGKLIISALRSEFRRYRITAGRIKEVEE